MPIIRYNPVAKAISALTVVLLGYVKDRREEFKWFKRFLTKPHVRFSWTIGLAQPKVQQGNNRMLEVSITNEQKIKATLAPVTDTGKPAKLDGKPTWTVQSGDSTVEVADDGLSATLVSSDSPGDTLVLVEADANLGEGVETVSDVIKLSVLGAQAKNLGLVLGQPEAK